MSHHDLLLQAIKYLNDKADNVDAKKSALAEEHIVANHIYP